MACAELWSPAASDSVPEHHVWHMQGSFSGSCKAACLADARQLVWQMQGSLSGRCKAACLADARQFVLQLQGNMSGRCKAACLAAQDKQQANGVHRGADAHGCCGRCWASCCGQADGGHVGPCRGLLRETSTATTAAARADNGCSSGPCSKCAGAACPAMRQQAGILHCSSLWTCSVRQD